MLYEGIEVNTRQTSKPQTVAAPIGGLNGRDALAGMNSTDAYLMDNVMPGTTSCRVRRGVADYSPGTGAPVTSLDVFSGGDALDIVLGVCGDEWVNVSADPVEVVKSGLEGIETVSTMFSTVADNAQFLIMTAEATQAPWQFDGIAATDLAFTGLNEDVRLINYVAQYMGRLFWATKGKLGFYYLPPGQIQGAMEWFDLGQITKKGGYLAAIATYSEDAGDGPNDYIVFITSKGEYIMYYGLDPGDVNSWSIVGRYQSAPPISRKCVLDYASDLVVLTLEGALQFSQIRKLADTRFELTALTSKLGDILLGHNQFRNTYGWSMALYPRGGWLVVSVPHGNTMNGLYHHFIMNTTTQAWSRIHSGEMNGLCWCVANDNLYYGRYDGKVRQADTGVWDIDQPIKWQVKQAYNYYGTPSYKHYKWATFLVKSEALAALTANMSVDYKEIQPNLSISNLDPAPGAIWDESFWDSDYFGTGPYTQRFIAPFGVYGVAASVWLAGSIGGATLEWFATETVYELAQGLLG